MEVRRSSVQKGLRSYRTLVPKYFSSMLDEVSALPKYRPLTLQLQQQCAKAMVLKIRLARFGKANKSFYNIVVAQARYFHLPRLAPSPSTSTSIPASPSCSHKHSALTRSTHCYYHFIKNFAHRATFLC